MKCCPSKLCKEVAKDDANLFPISLFTTVWTDLIVALPALNILFMDDFKLSGFNGVDEPFGVVSAVMVGVCA